MHSQKILLFGGSGFLGSRIIKNNKTIIAPNHSELDLLDIDKVFKYINDVEPNIIIYSAGISKMDFAQKNETITNKLNNNIPHKIAKRASRDGINFIYISTDAVFDGYKNKFEFSEYDKTNAKSLYGLSKQKGEDSILTFSDNCVIRVINLFGLGNENNFIQKMKNKLEIQEDFPGIIDQINNPLNVDIAAKSIIFSAENNLNGIYHLGALTAETNFNFLILAAKQMKLNSKYIKKIKFNEFMGDKISYRKKNSVLLTEKFNKITKKLILKNTKDSISYLNLK